MNELPEIGTKEYALADVISRPNALNGSYRKLQLPLEWQHLRMKKAAYITRTADWADKIIKEAVDNGKDLGDAKVQEELQSRFYGGVAGASVGIMYRSFLRFFGFRR